MNRLRCVSVWTNSLLLLLLFAQPMSLFAQERPAAQPLKVKPPTPEVMKILHDWERKSGSFQKLQGELKRWKYDFVFNSEKRAIGNFWYATPDKGRIDLEPWDDTRNPRNRDKNGKALPGEAVFKVDPDNEEQWVSDGRDITVVNTKDKTVDVYPIPQAIQGQGITDSPLPFLFGMKADKAARRYELTLVGQSADRIHLLAKPYLIQDARIWQSAEIMLDAKTFYPQAIKLIDPGGNSETVYQFLNVGEPNLFEKVVGGNPFVINKPNFKRVVHNDPKPRNVAAGGAFKMPRLIGMHWKETKELLEKAGFEVKLKQGVAAPRKELVYTIYDQSPQPAVTLEKGTSIVLTLYNKEPVQRGAAKPPAGSGAARR